MIHVYSHLVEAVRSAEDIAVINESAPADHLKAFNVLHYSRDGTVQRQFWLTDRPT